MTNKKLHPHEYGILWVGIRNCDEIFKMLIEDGDLLGLDIETFRRKKWKNDLKAGIGADFCSHRAQIRLVQIASEKRGTVYIVDMAQSCQYVLSKTISFLQKGKFFSHNAIFETQFIQALGVKMLNVHCTMVMYRMLVRASNPFPGKVSASLANMVKKLTNITVSKEEQTSDWSNPQLTESQVTYAARDAAYTLYCGNMMLPKIMKLMGKSYSINRYAINALARIIRAGIFFDGRDHQLLIDEWEKKRKKAEKKCDAVFIVTNEDEDGETTITPINIRSSGQLGKWLKENVEEDLLAEWPKTEKGALKTDAKTLDEYSYIPGLTELCEYKMYQKLLSTYGAGLAGYINPATKRLHPNYTLGFTTTGRLSSRSPNIQNQPTRENSIRKYFRAQSKTSTLVCADYSQVEVRVAAILSGDKQLLKAYREGADIYVRTGSLIYNKSEDKISKKERFTMKAVVLGLQFGMGPSKLALYAKQYGVDMTVEEAQDLVSRYRRAYPGLYAWQEKVSSAAADSLCTKTVGGMIRKLNSQNYYCCSMNTPVQGSAAEAMLMSLCILDKQLIAKKLPARIVCTVHDEIVVECKKSAAKKVKSLMEKSMLQGFKYVFPDPKGCDTNLVEALSGPNWEEIH